MYEWDRTREKMNKNKHESLSLILKEITSSRPHGPRENKSGYYTKYKSGYYTKYKSGYYTKSSASMSHTCWKHLSLSCPIYSRNVLLLTFIDKPYYTVKTYKIWFLHINQLSHRQWIRLWIKPGHNKTRKMTSLSSKYEHRPVHPRGLIGAIAVRINKLCVLEYP